MSTNPDGTTNFGREVAQSQAAQAALQTLANGGIFSKDLGYAWRNIYIPAASFRIQISQDLAEHKYSEKDGAEMEPTGRAPIKFSARIPFLNSILPGPNEKWKPGTLYPGVLQQMIVAMARRDRGVMQHPFLGNITCVPHEFDVEWSATTRDGTWANATWIETFDSSNDTAAILQQISPISQAIAAAQELDFLITSVQPPLPKTPTYAPNFADTMRSIQELFDTARFLGMSVSGTINNVGYRVNTILDSINKASNAPNAAIYSVMNGPARVACDRLRVACYNLKQQIATDGSPIGIYVTSGSTTLPDIVLSIAAISGGVEPDISDLLKLNGPLVFSNQVNLATNAIIPSGQIVRYYLPKNQPQPFTPSVPQSTATAF